MPGRTQQVQDDAPALRGYPCPRRRFRETNAGFSRRFGFTRQLDRCNLIRSKQSPNSNVYMGRPRCNQYQQSIQLGQPRDVRACFRSNTMTSEIDMSDFLGYCHCEGTNRRFEDSNPAFTCPRLHYHTHYITTCLVLQVYSSLSRLAPFIHYTASINRHQSCASHF